MNRRVFSVVGFKRMGGQRVTTLVSHKRRAGAGVGVGMLRGRGIPLVENKKSFLLGSLVSEFQRFKVLGIQKH